MNISKKDYPFELIHRKCAGVAFYYKNKPTFGDVIKARDAMQTTGKPRETEAIVCQSCKQLLRENEVGVAYLIKRT